MRVIFVEKESRLIAPKKLWQDLSAFANAGGGELLKTLNR